MIDAIPDSIEGECSTKTRTSEAEDHTDSAAFPRGWKTRTRFGFSKVFRWPVPAEANAPTDDGRSPWLFQWVAQGPPEL